MLRAYALAHVSERGPQAGVGYTLLFLNRDSDTVQVREHSKLKLFGHLSVSALRRGTDLASLTVPLESRSGHLVPGK